MTVVPLDPVLSTVELLNALVANQAYVPIVPTDKQLLLLTDPRRELLWGGAAGGGKSYGLLADALQFAHVPGYNALILRRSYGELALPGGLMDVADSWLMGSGAVRRSRGTEWEFPSGARLTFGHLAADRDKGRYQGSSFHFVGFDELTQFTESQYLYLFSRLRRPADGGADPAAEVPLRMRSTANPGGQGHEWVKARFVDPQPDGTEAERGFIPAGMDDNPHLDRASYREMLALLDPVTRAQLEHGDWDVRPAGNFFRTAMLGVVDPGELTSGAHGAGGLRCRAWDLAGTTGGDWSVGVLIAWLPRWRVWLVEDVVRVRQEPGDLERTLRETAERDGQNVPILIEQEGGSSGKLALRALRAELFGFPVRAVNPSGSKQARAQLPAAEVANGTVRMVRAPWNAEFVAELAAFPNKGMHDDQVDAFSYAVHHLSAQVGRGGGAILFSPAQHTISEIVARQAISGPSSPWGQHRIVRAELLRDRGRGRR